MLARISKQVVDRMPLNSVVWDTALIGFGARRQRKHVHYLLRYRINGRQRFHSIGRHGSWTPDSARTEVQRLLGLVASRVDPAAARQAEQKADAETFGTEVARYIERKRTLMKPRSMVELTRHLMVQCRPLHGLRLGDINRRTVAQRLGDIETASGPATRNRARSTLSAFFTWTISEGLLDVNPVTGTGVADEGPSRDRVLSETELTTIWKALGQDAFGDIVRLLVLTAQRRTEIGGLKWSEVDFVRGLLVWGPERTKNRRQHELPMSRQVRAILERQPRRDGGVFVFDHGAIGFNGWSDGKRELDARLVRVGPWRLHDLRRTAATMMAERLQVLPHVLECILNHVGGFRAGVHGVYNRSRYQNEMKDALDRWGDYVDGLTAV